MTIPGWICCISGNVATMGRGNKGPAVGEDPSPVLQPLPARHRSSSYVRWFHWLVVWNIWIYPLVMTNVAMGNDPFIEVFPLIAWWFSIAMLNYQRVYFSIGNNHHPNWRSHIFQRGRSTTNQFITNVGWTVIKQNANHQPQRGRIDQTYPFGDRHDNSISVVAFSFPHSLSKGSRSWKSVLKP